MGHWRERNRYPTGGGIGGFDEGSDVESRARVGCYIWGVLLAVFWAAVVLLGWNW